MTTAGLLYFFGASEIMAVDLEKNQPDSGQEEKGVLTKVKEHVSFNGTIEIEARWNEDFAGSSESDIALATAEFGVEAKVTDWVVGTLALEWLDDEDKIDVDEAFITLGNSEKFPAAVKVGRYVVPFGTFAGNTISDPLTLEAFETKEDAIMVGFEHAGMHGGAYAFNGDTNEGEGDDTIEHFGAHLGYALKNDSFSFDFGGGYISSIIDSDGLSEVYDMSADYVGGVAFQTKIGIAGFSLLGEYITAIDDYQPTELETAASKPSAYHVEAGYEVAIAEFPLLFTLAYSGTKELAGILQEGRLAVVAGIELSEGLSLSCEYTQDTDYEIAEGGTGAQADAFTVQLAYEF